MAAKVLRGRAEESLKDWDAALADYRNVFFRDRLSFGGSEGEWFLCRLYLKMNQPIYAQEPCAVAADRWRSQDATLAESVQVADFLLSTNELRGAARVVGVLLEEHAEDSNVQRLEASVRAGLCAIGSPDCKTFPSLR
jgi:hypothetical protein